MKKNYCDPEVNVTVFEYEEIMTGLSGLNPGGGAGIPDTGDTDGTDGDMGEGMV